ncbi:hypothetical protein IQ07DRAFT_649596 [Pyrenochaeta sp. DS3sAY3a]|nr:hypothetical protein IQ07DRAFT_649596 [Pyrenochaeta sp. DS3sAY3a]
MADQRNGRGRDGRFVYPQQGSEGYGYSSNAGYAAPPAPPYDGGETPASNAYNAAWNNTGYGVQTGAYSTYSAYSTYPSPSGYVNVNPNAGWVGQQSVPTHQPNPAYISQSSNNQSFNQHGQYPAQTASLTIAQPSYELPASPQPAQSVPQTSYSPSSSQQQTSIPQGSPQSMDEYTTVCPYNCGTILTGVHAQGNLTRHLKSQACSGSGRAKMKHSCPVDRCGREYTRSDGLRVHMRRRHGAPPALSRAEDEAYPEVEEEY